MHQFELLQTMRHTLGISWEEMTSRLTVLHAAINGFTGVPVPAIDVANLMFDGTGGECKHCYGWGQCKNPDQECARVHGTNDVKGLLSPFYLGRQLPSERPLKNKPGFYHFPKELWQRALEYAPPTCLGTGKFRCICEYDIRCFNSCEGQRDWSYTHKKCTRYCLVAIHFFPEWACAGTRLL